MTSTVIRRVDNPYDEIVDEAADLFCLLMKDDLSGISLCGGDPSLMKPMACAIICACALEGEFYAAVDAGTRELVGYALWMPTGHELFESEAQRKLGFDDFLRRLSDAGKRFYKDTYLKQFPGFVNRCLGPSGRPDAWWLHQIMVRPQNQRRGIATSLIDLVKEKAGKKHQRLAVSVTSEANVPIYTNQGFAIRGRLELISPWGDYPLIVFSLDT